MDSEIYRLYVFVLEYGDMVRSYKENGSNFYEIIRDLRTGQCVYTTIVSTINKPKA